MIELINLLKTIMQISGVIASIMALLYINLRSKLEVRNPFVISKWYPDDEPRGALIKYLGFIKQILMAGLFSSLSIIFGFLSFIGNILNDMFSFYIFLILSFIFFSSSIIILIAYFGSQMSILKEDKESLKNKEIFGDLDQDLKKESED